jgi:DNA/RNA endonuclease YhcR with UshA esterase domain
MEQPPLTAAPAAPAPAAAVAPATPALSPMSELSLNHLGKDITLVGKLTNKIPATSDRAPHRWYVTDDKGVALVVMFPNVYGQLTTPDVTFPIGAVLQVKGTIKEFRGVLQVVPNSGSGVTIAPAGSPMGVLGLVPVPAVPAAPGVPGAPQAALPTAPAAIAIPADALAPNQVTQAMVKQTVRVAGKVKSFRAAWNERAPSIITIEGGGATLDVVYWKQVDEALGAKKAQVTAVGAMLVVKGEINEFRDNLQLQVANPEDIALLSVPAPAAPAAPAAADPAMPAAPAAPPAPAAADMPTGVESRTPSQITKADVGKTFVVSGTVQAVRLPRNETTPTRITLVDSQGAITVVYWSDSDAAFSGSGAAREGMPWSVLGKVSEYREDLQLRAERPVPLR